MTKEEKFQEFLTLRGLRATGERAQILEKVFSSHRHFSAKDLVRELGAQSHTRSRVSKATIYRTLALLVESGLLRQVITGDKRMHYEHVFGHAHHDHLECTRCGAIIEFCEPEIERLQEKVCAKKGFLAEGHRLQILGLCSKCAKRKT